MKQIQSYNIKQLTRLALLLALEILLSRFLSISTPIVKIGFSFVPIVVAAMCYGPCAAASVYALGDFMGALLFPIGPYFPGFTLTAFLSGLTYGVLLYRRPRSIAAAVTAVVIVTMILQLGLDSVWLTILTGKGFWAILPTRILKCAIIAPIQFLCIRFLSNYGRVVQSRPLKSTL